MKIKITHKQTLLGCAHGGTNIHFLLIALLNQTQSGQHVLSFEEMFNSIVCKIFLECWPFMVTAIMLTRTWVHAHTQHRHRHKTHKTHTCIHNKQACAYTTHTCVHTRIQHTHTHTYTFASFLVNKGKNKGSHLESFFSVHFWFANVSLVKYSAAYSQQQVVVISVWTSVDLTLSFQPTEHVCVSFLYKSQCETSFWYFVQRRALCLSLQSSEWPG